MDVFVASNTSTAQTQPAAAIAGCNSTFDGKPVTPGCLSYQVVASRLSGAPTTTAAKTSPSAHMHGWPCFASNAIADFFLGLP